MYYYSTSCLSIICSVYRLKRRLGFAIISSNKVQLRLLKSFRSVSFFFLRHPAHCFFQNDGCSNIVVSICFCVDDPQSDPNATGDPYKTLFVARLVSYFVTNWHILYSRKSLDGKLSLLHNANLLCAKFLQNYETSEHKIKREFEAYGPIKRVSICGKFLCRWSYCTLVRFFSHFKMQTIVGQNCGEQFMAHFMFLWKVFAISGVIMCLCCAISDLEFPESCTYLFSLWVLKIFMQMFFLMKIGKHLFCIFSHCLVNMVLVFYLNSSFRSYWLFALFHTSENTLFALKYFTVNLLWVLYFFLRL